MYSGELLSEGREIAVNLLIKCSILLMIAAYTEQ